MPNAAANPRSYWSTNSRIGCSYSFTPRLRQRVSESLTLPELEKREGIVIATTFSEPIVSVAKAKVSALSIPPEDPTTTCLKPQRRA
ncbi:hypothetical protein GALL_554610 [mine drainage metagenome]|uniref:Uncharacterized protein n=1 Tax=mine drainage metagenome TaxID=410659 RepID=A0A1J5P6F3_9ZZZZ